MPFFVIIINYKLNIKPHVYYSYLLNLQYIINTTIVVDYIYVNIHNYALYLLMLGRFTIK